MKRLKRTLGPCALGILLTLGGCGSDGADALVSITSESAGANCAAGGQVISTGLDDDGDGMLSAEEVTATSYICNGADGHHASSSLSNEVAGSNCENGGTRIDTGSDVNDNGTLDAEEINSTQYVCDGVGGTSHLTSISAEDAGDNCAEGGVKVDSGADENANGTLESSEIQSSEYVCDGSDGIGVSFLTVTSAEAAGDNCAEGGLLVNGGLDTSADGVLDAAEITSTGYVCNGATGTTGAAGVAFLMDSTVESAGTNCADGGFRVAGGIDISGDSVLDAGEVTQIGYICNGADGSAANSPVVEQGFAQGVSSLGVDQIRTLTSLTITVPAGGTIIAIGTTDAYCESTATATRYDCASAGVTEFSVAVLPNQVTSPGGATNHHYAHLTPDATTPTTTTTTFDVGAAGTYTYYLRAQTGAGEVGFWRRGLVLMYLPD